MPSPSGRSPTVVDLMGAPTQRGPRVTAEVTARRPISSSAADEMRKTLSHLFDDVCVRVDGTRVQVEARGCESAAELGRVLEHFVASHREVPVKVVMDRRARAGDVVDGPRTSGPPRPGAPDDRLADGWGGFLQGPAWLADLRAVEAYVTQRLTERFCRDAWQTPALMDENVLADTGYYSKFPHLVSAVHRLRPDYWDIVGVSRLDPLDAAARHASFAPSGTALTPVTCYHAYAHAAELLEHDGPEGVFHIRGPVFRHEGRSHGPTRLAEFTMTEMVAMGSAAHVQEHHAAFLATFVHLLEDLDVDFYVCTASDPFFATDDANMLRAAQLMSAAKYEVRISIAGEDDLSVASVNRHGAAFIKPFGLDALGVEETCCAGIGLERLT